jgi:UDP-3-O-[3-hydroxymyristoyl] N-acetylglucosamine deacetylase/3-hydroxyacyl-[acyl-carrier-protein] dehydratase
MNQNNNTLLNNNPSPNQHTLKAPVTLSGVGLHTGADVIMTIKPANPGFGVRFQRIDLPDQPVVKADADLVVDTSRGTTIEQGGARISTIEHLLAALVGLNIDNALIELNAPEVPILDGSSKIFIEAIESAGIQEQDAKRIVYTLDSNIHFYDPVKNVDMLAIPSKDYQITTMIDFNSPILGTQHASLRTIPAGEQPDQRWRPEQCHSGGRQAGNPGRTEPPGQGL